MFHKRSEMTESAIGNFCRMSHLHNLIKDSTCFKNLEKPSCIDLILTNFCNSFLKSQTFETVLSDFHKLTMIVLQIHYKRQKPLVIAYRDYKNFQMKISAQSISAMGRYSNIYFADFHSEFLYLLDKNTSVHKSYTHSLPERLYR